MPGYVATGRMLRQYETRHYPVDDWERPEPVHPMGS